MVARGNRVERRTIAGEARVLVDVPATLFSAAEAHRLADAIREAAGLPAFCPVELIQAASRLRRRLALGGTSAVYSLEGKGSRCRIEILGTVRSVAAEGASIAEVVKILDEVQRSGLDRDPPT